MTGKYDDIEAYNNRSHYFLKVEKNITILQGDSATGKIELVRLIRDREENGNSSGFTIKCDKKCTVLTNIGWGLRLQPILQHIVCVDETSDFLRSERFSELFRNSDNYCAAICRDALSRLPYSVEEIYGLHNISGD